MCETNIGGYSKERNIIHPDPKIKITKYVIYKMYLEVISAQWVTGKTMCKIVNCLGNN